MSKHSKNNFFFFSKLDLTLSNLLNTPLLDACLQSYPLMISDKWKHFQKDKDIWDSYHWQEHLVVNWFLKDNQSWK